MIPHAFCWTRIGVESGETLDSIVQRKELERRANLHGRFFWGVGNPLGGAVASLLQETSTPIVVFSPIASTAASIDTEPGDVFLWTTYRDHAGDVHDLPLYTIVTSRANTARGYRKSAHYALVCSSRERLSLEDSGKLRFDDLRNLSTGTRLGNSQVTAIVSYRRSQSASAGRLYPIVLEAEMVSPYAVELGDPTIIDQEALADIRLAASCNDVDRWRLVSQSIRERFAVPRPRAVSLPLG